MTIKAVPTTYAGVTFRSRLEARTAVFFDAAGISWEYEPVRVALEGGGTYLPDFRTNESGYVEVKGAEENLDKPYLLRAADALGHLTILGPIPDCRKGIPGRTVLLARPNGQDPRVNVTWHDYRKHRRGCPSMEEHHGPWLTPPFLSSEYFGITPNEHNKEWRGQCMDGKCPYDAARGARFEHGQSGRV